MSNVIISNANMSNENIELSNETSSGEISTSKIPRLNRVTVETGDSSDEPSPEFFSEILEIEPPDELSMFFSYFPDPEPEKVMPRFVQKQFEKGENFWKDLATFVKDELQLLKSKEPSVEATYSFRVKGKNSLLNKIKKVWKSDQSVRENLCSMKNMNWDIAGTRICLYFPIQIIQVRDFIEHHEVLEVIPQGPTGIPKLFREREHKNKNQETRPYEERMGYYNADHYWIRLQKDNVKVKEKFPTYEGEAIEIQVRTVLMDAWAEIRHDIEYKHILGYPGEEELRVLDAIKGTIASCEIMQNHLFILRKQRLFNDDVPFVEDEGLQHFWQVILNSLRPRHQILLRGFGEKQPKDCNSLMAVLSRFRIYTPKNFKKEIAYLASSEVQKERMALSQRALEIMNSNFKNHPKARRLEVSGLYDFERPLSLASFLVISQLSRLPISDILDAVHTNYDTYVEPRYYDKHLHKTHTPGLSPPFKHPHCGLQEHCAFKWFKILCVVLDCIRSNSFKQYKNYGIQAVSIVWHIHEWASAMLHYSDKHHQIISVAASLFQYFQQSSNNLAVWIFATAIQTLQTGYLNWINQSEVGRHIHESTLVCFGNKDWCEGSQVAAKIISIELSELKNVLVYRALCSDPLQTEYVQQCLWDKEFNVNWQDECGISILGAVAAFGTPEICNELLHVPGNADVNIAFPDGLSLIHIAVGYKNVAMIKKLIMNPKLQLGSVWKQEAHSSYEEYGSPVGDHLRRLWRDRNHWRCRWNLWSKKNIWYEYYKNEDEISRNLHLALSMRRKNLTWTAVEIAMELCTEPPQEKILKLLQKRLAEDPEHTRKAII